MIVESHKRILGIIGGSGLYNFEGLQGVREQAIESPFGKPSAPLLCGELNGVEIVFLARHGAGHRIPPGDINYRANIDALKRAGVTDIISVSACGSFREELAPGNFVIVDNFIDRTTTRAKSFFSEGFVAHVSMAQPVCLDLADSLAAGCEAIGVHYHKGGVYLAMDGPQFSSRAESLLYKSWGCDVIGMTNMPEAKLAREAEIPYATVAMVTDYDCWRENEDGVDVASVLAIMAENTKNAARLIDDVASRLGPHRNMSRLQIEQTLDFAVITSPDQRDKAVMQKLNAILARFLKR